MKDVMLELMFNNTYSMGFFSNDLYYRFAPLAKGLRVDMCLLCFNI